MSYYKYLILCLMLLLTSILSATEMTIQEKELEAKRLGDEFKAQTGFVGNFNYNLEDMTFRSLIGKFPDVIYNQIASQETQLALAERIINLAKPYINVPWDQVKFDKVILESNGKTFVEYIQEIPGLGFDDNKGGLSVSFIGNGIPEVILSNNLVVLGDMLSHGTITKQQAIDIMLPIQAKYGDKAFQNEALGKRFPPNAVLRYGIFTIHGKYLPRIYWDAYWHEYYVKVDAVTGEVLEHGSSLIE